MIGAASSMAQKKRKLETCQFQHHQWYQSHRTVLLVPSMLRCWDQWRLKNSERLATRENSLFPSSLPHTTCLSPNGFFSSVFSFLVLIYFLSFVRWQETTTSDEKDRSSSRQTIFNWTDELISITVGLAAMESRRRRQLFGIFSEEQISNQLKLILNFTQLFQCRYIEMTSSRWVEKSMSSMGIWDVLDWKMQLNNGERINAVN